MGCLRRPELARSPKVVSLCPGHALLRIQLWMMGVGCGDEGVGEESQREGGMGMALPWEVLPAHAPPSPNLPRGGIQQGRPGA